MKLGLVLSGGGAKGAFEAGVCKAIAEAGLTPEILSGTSAGALNVAGLAHGLSADELADVWRRTRASDVFRMRRDVWSLPRPAGWMAAQGVAARVLHAIGWTWLLHTAPLERTLRGVLGGDRVEVRDGLAVAVSAVEKASGDLVRFVNTLPPPHRRDRRYREVELAVGHLMASAALPLVFRPAELDGLRWWDGGLVANTPLAPALAFEPDRVIVVTTATRPRPAPRPASLADAIGLLIDNVLAFSLAADLKRAELVNELCRLDPSRSDVREVDILVVEPTGLDLGGSLDFDAELAERRLEAGLEIGRRELEAWL
jgi:NTE family protein